ncbi:MAG: glycosyltransferase [bacterium]|nr:glycosyltransferase [bacterium]
MLKKRVLLLTMSVGMGHLQSAEAIKKGIAEICQESEIRLFDPLAYTNPKFANFINNYYLWMIKVIPGFWGFIYDSKLISSKYSPVRLFTQMKFARSIAKVLDGFRPDVVVCTHAFATCGAASLKSKGVINAPLISVATEFDIHPYSIDKMVDLYIVPSEDFKHYLEDKGISSDKIKTCGIPIDPKFKEWKDKKGLKRDLGLEINKPVVLVLGGGFGFGVDKLVRPFKNSTDSIQLIVVTGKNVRVKSKLEKEVRSFKIPVKIFGFVNNMEDLMEVSDIVVTRGVGSCGAEALSKGLPLIIFKPIRGQGVKSTRFLVNAGVAIQVEKACQIPETITDLLSRPNKLGKMACCIQQLAKPSSSLDIARVLVNG